MKDDMIFRCLIGGEWVTPSVHEPNCNPSDFEDIVGVYGLSDVTDAEQAINAAHEAAPSWASSSPQVRFDLLDRAGTLILERRAELGRLLAREEGKILAEATAEAVRAGQIFKYFAGEALRQTGDMLPSIRPGVDVEVSREPVGVCVLITPWNFPIAIPAWKLAPALAFGNTVVLKPAELTPGSAHALVAILHEAGAPPGVINLLTGRGSDLGDVLTASRKVNAVSFTGSVNTGRRIAARCAERGIRVQCEMGGKNPLVVVDDADINVAVAAALNGAFFSTGQRCTASSRLIVTEGIHDRFVAALEARMHTLRVGHALDPMTEIGPVVDAHQLERNDRYLALAKNEGAKVIGGARARRDTEGFFLKPALIVDTDASMRINREEIFGPIASIIRVADYESALAVANDSEFGLSAGICTTSLATARHFKRHVEAGMVMINLPTAGVDYHVPFGGRKGSSYGPREQGSYAREFYSIVKTAYVG